MPPDRFSKAVTISSPPSTGVGCASCLKTPVEGRRHQAGHQALALDRQPPEARLLAAAARQKSSSARWQLQHQQPAEQRAADGQPQADDLDHAHLGRAEGHALQQKGVISEPAKASPSYHSTMKARNAAPRWLKRSYSAAQRCLKRALRLSPSNQRRLREGDASSSASRFTPSAASASSFSARPSSSETAAHAPAAARSSR